MDPLSEAAHGIAPAAACIKEPSLYVLAAISVAYFLAFQCTGKCERKSRDFSLQLQLQQLQQQELLSASLSNQATCCTRFTNGPWPGSHCVRVCRCVRVVVGVWLGVGVWAYVGKMYLYAPFFDNDAANWQRLSANRQLQRESFFKEINEKFPLKMHKTLPE